MINNLLVNNFSIICGYNYSWLFGNHKDTFRHVSIVVGTSQKDETILILDPGPKDAGFKYVRANDLYDAIRAGKDGLWCIFMDN